VARKIAVANNKGGTAKSTTACNLADMIARELMRPDGVIVGRVLLIDMDPQGHVARSLGLRDRVYDKDRNPDGACISFLLTGERDFKRSVIPADRSADGLPRPNLYVAPSTPRLRHTGAKLAALDYAARQSGDPEHVPLDDVLNRRFAGFAHAFDFIIVDCPPNLDYFRRPVYRFVDEVIVPVRPDDLSVDGLVQHTRDLLEMNGEGARARITHILPTMVRSRQVLDQFSIGVLSKKYSGIVAAPIPDLVAVREAPARAGRTLTEYAPDSAATAAYQQFARQVLR